MTRKEKIKWIIEAVYLIEGVEIDESNFRFHSDEYLDEQMDWYDYLLDK